MSPDRKTPSPETAFCRKLLAEKKSPSERRPVSRWLSSTTSASIEASRMELAMLSVPVSRPDSASDGDPENSAATSGMLTRENEQARQPADDVRGHSLTKTIPRARRTITGELRARKPWKD